MHLGLQKMDRLAAAGAFKDKGGLPHHEPLNTKLFDLALMSREDSTSNNSSVVRKILEARKVWAREFLIEPPENGVFDGTDIANEYTDEKGRTWIFRGSKIPQDALRREGVTLFVDPDELITEQRRGRTLVIVEPANIIIVPKLVEDAFPAQWGKIYPGTALPVRVSKKEYDQAGPSEIRTIKRYGSGITPLTCGMASKWSICDKQREVGAESDPAEELGVLGVEYYAASDDNFGILSEHIQNLIPGAIERFKRIYERLKTQEEKPHMISKKAAELTWAEGN